MYGTGKGSMRVDRTPGGYPRSKVLLAILGWAWGLFFGGIVHADPLADVQLLRDRGCGGIAPGPGRLQRVDKLDRAAAQWASGRSLFAAAENVGYAADKLTGLRVAGSDPAILQNLRQTSCLMLMKKDLNDVGMYRRGRDVWIVLASTYFIPSTAHSEVFGARVLDLVNEARARGISCGARVFGPARPIRPSAALAQAAYRHALDMAQHSYFEHQDLAGRTPADRVREVGYREKLVGENIAYGPRSPEEVVSGWLESPGHCENIMDPRFVEMGVAFALGHVPARSRAAGMGLYWVQVLADPRI
jgi:uncharacterized protein YkwD